MENKQKLMLTIILGIILFAILIYPIKKTPETPYPPTPEKFTEIEKAFSKFQIAACIAASEGGGCNTKLIDLGIITPEECCKSYGKCC